MNPALLRLLREARQSEHLIPDFINHFITLRLPSKLEIDRLILLIAYGEEVRRIQRGIRLSADLLSIKSYIKKNYHTLKQAIKYDYLPYQQ